jgi:hypothetical protein
VFTVPEMGFNRPKPPPARTGAPPPRGYSHSGHSHGPGTRPHSH